MDSVFWVLDSYNDKKSLYFKWKQSTAEKLSLLSSMSGVLTVGEMNWC